MTQTPEQREIARLQRHLDEDPELLLKLQRTVYSQSFREFVRAAWPHIDTAPFKPNWHIDAMCDHLQAQSQGKLQNLIISVPPGSAKSLLAGVMWPCWEWTHSPSVQILATSAEESLAGRDNGRARKLLKSPWYQSLFPIELSGDTDSKLKFVNEHLGHREASPMSSLTGKRANRVIVDDAISASNARSDALREKVNETFWTNAPSRVNDPARDTTTIIQQRLHELDLVGSILEREPEFWDKLVIPMEYVPTTHVTNIGWTDPRKEPGELLFEAHWPREYCQRMRAQDSFKYASQYQQNPVPTEDGFFERSWFKRYREHEKPPNLLHYMTSDHAKGGSKASDYNVVRIWGLDEHKNIWLVASYREQTKFQTAMGIATDDGGRLSIADRGALAMVRRYRPLAWFAESDNIFSSNIDLIRETMRANNLYVRIIEVPHGGRDKEERAIPLQAMAEGGKVYLPDNHVGDAALDEYVSFPVGKHDDQVDADAIIPRMIRAAHAALVAPKSIKRESDGYVAAGTGGDRPDNWATFF